MTISRSENMRRIQGVDTGPERTLRQVLWSRGHRYRKDYRSPYGRIDIAFPGRKIAILIDGCFWHGCPDHYVSPRTRRHFWSSKLRENVDRDRRQTRSLVESGWLVIRVWEHEIMDDPESCADKIENQISAGMPVLDGGWRVVLVNPVPGTDDLEDRTEEPLMDEGSRRRTRRKRHTRKTGPAPDQREEQD